MLPEESCDVVVAAVVIRWALMMLILHAKIVIPLLPKRSFTLWLLPPIVFMFLIILEVLWC
jgi:hypothetical protein